MLRTAAYQHYWTVRGRGFHPKQWRALLRVTNRIVKNALEDGVKVKYEAQADMIRITPSQGDGEVFRLFRNDGNAETFNSVRTDMDPYDDVVVSVLTAAKKIAPDLIEISSDGGADVFRRKYAKIETVLRDILAFAPGGGAGGDGGGDIGHIDVGDGDGESKSKAFSKAVEGQKFYNHATGNWVVFHSLPGKAQSTLRKRFEDKWKQQAAKAKTKSKQHAEKTKKITEQARQKAEQSSGKAAPDKGRPKGKNAMDEQTVRDAAIRVAAETSNPQLKQAILTILSGKKLPPEFLKNIKKKEDADGDDDSSKGESDKPWEKKDKKAYEKTLVSAYSFFLPAAQKSVTEFYAANPDSKVASGSTAQRVQLASQIARRWVREAVADSSLVRKATKVPAGKRIALSDIEKAIPKASDKTLRTLIVAKMLQENLGSSKKGSTRVAMEELMAAYKYSADDMAEMEREAGCKLGKKWIQDAIKRPGRVRAYLGVPEGEDIPKGKLNEAIKKEKGTGNKSLLSALILAKRLKGMK